MTTAPPSRAEAPALLPGAVLAAPDGGTGRVLRDFARELAARGWRTGGVVIETRLDAGGEKRRLDLIELGRGERRLVLDAAALEEGNRIIRRAVAERAELVVVDGFGPIEGGGQGFSEGLRAALDAGSPLLVAVPGELLERFDRFAATPTALLRPETAALWRWWGPYRLYEELARGVADAPASRVIAGLNWTLVEGPDGIGLAHSPARDAPGCRTAARLGDYAGTPLGKLARLALSWNPFEAAIGLAAINAHYNRHDLAGAAVNGLDHIARLPGRKLVIGRFPELERRIPDARVIERAPGPGDLPEAAADWLLGAADAVAVTASALGNLTLPRLLSSASGARMALVGPGTPLSPQLHAYGIEVLSGLVIEDGERAARAVAEGGAVKALKACGRQVTLVQGRPPPAEGSPEGPADSRATGRKLSLHQ